MKITHYRTVAIIYPHLSLEVKVEDGSKTYYVNMSVNDKGREETIWEDGWWSYNKQLDQITAENHDESIVFEDFTEILEQMVSFWNSNPVFENNPEWKEWTGDVMSEALKSVTKRIVALMGGDELATSQILDETKGLSKIEAVLAHLENYYGPVDITEKTSSEVFTLLSETQKDDIFRMVWSTHVYEDALSHIDEDVEEEEREAIATEVANKYIYYGKYDCELSYWNNIENLIKEVSDNDR